jgi:hypothetical protein
MRKLENLDDIGETRNRERVWFVSSHGCGSCRLGEEQSILRHLQMVGKRLASFDSEGASVYLYALKDRRQGPAFDAAALDRSVRSLLNKKKNRMGARHPWVYFTDTVTSAVATTRLFAS